MIFEPDRGAADGLNKAFRGPPGKSLDRSMRTTFCSLDRSNWLQTFSGSIRNAICGLATDIKSMARDEEADTSRPEVSLPSGSFSWNPMAAAIRLFPGRSFSSLTEIQFREPHVLGRRIVCEYRKPRSKHWVYRPRPSRFPHSRPFNFRFGKNAEGVSGRLSQDFSPDSRTRLEGDR